MGITTLNDVSGLKTFEANVQSQNLCRKVNNVIPDYQTCFVYRNGVRESMEFGRGGPAVCREPNNWPRYKLYGIFSFDNRARTCDTNRFVFYTKTSYYIDWINTNKI